MPGSTSAVSVALVDPVTLLQPDAGTAHAYVNVSPVEVVQLVGVATADKANVSPSAIRVAK